MNKLYFLVAACLILLYQALFNFKPASNNQILTFLNLILIGISAFQIYKENNHLNKN